MGELELLSDRLRFSVGFSYATLARLLSLYATVSIVCAHKGPWCSAAVPLSLGWASHKGRCLWLGPPPAGGPGPYQRLCINLDYHPQELIPINALHSVRW